MSPLHKFVSFFQSDTKNNNKSLIHHKIFSSDLNICSGSVDAKKNHWGSLNGYRKCKGICNMYYYTALINA